MSEKSRDVLGKYDIYFSVCPGIESEDTSEVDMEGMDDAWAMTQGAAGFGDGALSRSTPKVQEKERIG